MKKGELIELSKNLMEETLYARAYKDILDQYKTLRYSFKDELMLSSTFHLISKMALVEALTMRLARLYDTDEKSAGLGFLLKQANQNIDYFPRNRGEHSFECDGHIYTFIAPLTHTLRECEKCYYKERVRQEEGIANLFDLPPNINIEVKINELVGMYQKRFASLNKERKNLITQRNKIYAHNDRETNFEFNDIYAKNPLFYNDIEKLLEFAEDFTSFCYEYLSGNYAMQKFSNIDDLESTLLYARKGLQQSINEEAND